MTNVKPDFARNAVPQNTQQVIERIHNALIRGGFSSARTNDMGYDMVVYEKPFELSANGHVLQGSYVIEIGLRSGHPGMIKMTAQRDKIPGEAGMYEQKRPITGRGFILLLNHPQVESKIFEGIEWLRQCKEKWYPGSRAPEPPKK